MRFGVIYFETWGNAQPYFAFSTLEFHSCFFAFTRTHTRYRILLPCLNQCLLCSVSSLFSWLVGGACLPCLVVKMLSGEGSSLVWSGWVCLHPLGPPVNPWTTGTVGRQFVLSIHCVQSVPVTWSVSLPVSLSCWEEMSLSSDEYASESDSNISSVMHSTVWRNSAHNEPSLFWL
jgi:hypothetical protein